MVSPESMIEGVRERVGSDQEQNESGKSSPEKQDQKHEKIHEALKDVKEKLDSLKRNVESENSLNEEERKNLQSFVEDLLSIEKNNKDLQKIEKKLEKGQGIEKKDIETVGSVVEGLKDDVDNMKEKEKEIIIDASKRNLFELQQQIDPKKKLKKEILGNVENASLFGFGFIGFGGIIEDIMGYFEKKYTGEAKEDEEGGFLSKLGMDFNFDEIWVKMKLGMLSMFAPDIHKKLKKYEQLLSGGGSEVVDGASEAAEKQTLSPEQIEQLGGEVKDTVREMLEKVNPGIEDENYEKFFSEWWGKVGDKFKDGDIEINFKKAMNKLKSGDIPNVDVLFGILGIGTAGVMDFICLGYKHNIIDLSTLAIEAGKAGVEGGVEVVQQSLMFVPNMAGLILGQVPLEDVLKYLDVDYIPEEYNTPLLVMIYKGLDTKAGWVLKELASRPGHIISAAAGQLGEDASKFKIGRETFRNNGIENRLEVLAKIEKKLGVETPLYGEIQDLIVDYKKGLALSSVYGTAENGEDFIHRLESLTDSDGNRIFSEMDIKSISELKYEGKLVRNMNANEFKNISHMISQEVYSYADRVRKASAKFDLPKTVSSFFKGPFSKRGFAEKVSNDLSTSLTRNADALANEKIWDHKMLRKYNELKAGLQATKHTDAYDFSRLINSQENPLEKIRTLAKSSPEMLKFLFGEFPVLILAKHHFTEMVKDFKEGNFGEGTSEIGRIFLELTPIIGPVSFILENGEEIEFDWGSAQKIGVGTIWFLVDGFMLARSIKAYGLGQGIVEEVKYGPRAAKNLVKGTSQGIVGFRELGKNVRMYRKGGRGVSVAIKEALRVSGRKPKMALAVLMTGIGIRTTAEVADAMGMTDEEADELKEKMQAVKKSDGNLESYIRDNRENGEFSEEERKYIVKFTMMNYLPIQNPASITEVEFTETQEKGKKEDLIKVYMPNQILKGMPQGELQNNMERFKEIFGSSIEVRSDDELWF